MNLEIRIIDGNKVSQKEKIDLYRARQKKLYEIGKEVYLYSETCLIEEDGKNIIYYRRGQKEPIKLGSLEEQRNFNTSFDAKTILMSNALREILSSEDIKNLKFWLIAGLITTLGSAIIIIFMLVQQGGGTVIWEPNKTYN